MKYILGLSVAYKPYRNRNGLLRIYSKDRLIDEISLNDEIKYVSKIVKKSLVKQYLLEPEMAFDDLYLCNYKHLIPKQVEEREYKIPSKLFLFELDAEDIGEKITLEFFVNGNNFTNGFMTKFSYIQLHSIFLVPKKFFKGGTILKIMKKLYIKSIRIQPEPPDPNKIYHAWPGASFIKYRGQSFNPKSPCYDLYEVKLGGDFILEIDVVKKHKIKLFSNKERPHGQYYADGDPFALIMLYDLINRFNEDQ